MRGFFFLTEFPINVAVTILNFLRNYVIVATECAEVRTEHQNIQENLASDSSTSSDLKINNHGEAAAVKSSADAYDASATESTEVQTHHQITQEKQIEGIGGLSVSNFDISPEFEIHDNDKDADIESGVTMPVGSLNKADINIGAVNVGVSSDNGNCPNHLESSKGDNLSLKANTSIDCNLEAQQSAEETNSCPNGFLSGNGNDCKL